MSDTARGIADLRPLQRAQDQRAWYWYDWANSAYFTTVATVLFAPYIISIAERAAVDNRISLLGIPVAPGSLPSYLVTFSTILSAVLLPPLGALVDRSGNKPRLLGWFAWTGALFASLLFFCTGDNWQIGAVAAIGANLCIAASLVVNDSILPDISLASERDRVSSRGWAFGYLGGGLLLIVNLGMFLFHRQLGMTEGFAVRLSMLSAALWWAGFTVIPYLRLRRQPALDKIPVDGGLVRQSFSQLARTLREMRRYPVAITFLGAYLLFNDGIQTVIVSSSTYGSEELGFGQTVLIGTILIVQFVAFAGALLFGRLAASFGAKRTILMGLVGWMVIVTVALVMPAGQVAPFLLLAVAIGVVLGGTQALARSQFSVFIPRGKEAEFFSFYHAVDRGTSWFGTLVFGLVYQLTDSYRPAIFALIVFFLLGGLLMMKVDTAQGMRDAGNVTQP
ncbi:MAG: MFS transporter [Nocardioides sp.]